MTMIYKEQGFREHFEGMLAGIVMGAMTISAHNLSFNEFNTAEQLTKDENSLIYGALSLAVIYGSRYMRRRKEKNDSRTLRDYMPNSN